MSTKVISARAAPPLHRFPGFQSEAGTKNSDSGLLRNAPLLMMMCVSPAALICELRKL